MHSAARSQLPARFVRPEVIGEGAIGIVYRAWDSVRQETVAVKTLQKATPAHIRWLKREFRTVASLSHPNLVVLHELFREQELWSFSMELVRGQRLQCTGCGVAPNTGSEQRLRAQFAELAGAIDALHQAGVVHRDIKPDNVVVEDTGRVVLLDFGLVTEVEAESEPEGSALVFAGSPSYMSPEQVLGKPLTPASDWYSFGTTLYEALTGQLPFDATGNSALMRKLSGELRPLEAGVEASPEVANLCLALLSTEPSERPDFDQIWDVLGTVHSERPSTAPPSGAVPRTLVGRHSELAAIHEWLQPEKRVEPCAVVLRGLSGMGKTTLAQAALRRMRSQGCRVLRSACMPQEAVPFNAWDGLIDELCDLLASREREHQALRIHPSLVRLFPVLGSLTGADSVWEAANDDPIQVRNDAVRALRQLLHDLSETLHIILFIDDIQWADGDSLRLLRELLVADNGPPISLLLAYRLDAQHSAAIDSLFREPSFRNLTRTLDLRPMPEEEALLLLRRLGVHDATRLRLLVAEAEGDPFFLCELARSEEVNTSSVSLSSVLEQRLEALPETSRRLFEIVALVGRPVPLDVAVKAAGIDAGGSEVAHRLRAAGLVRLTGKEQELEAYHDRWRRALGELVRPERRRERLMGLAKAFELRDTSSHFDILATCYRQCGESGVAADYAVKAANAAQTMLAFEVAARWYETALELRAWPTERSLELWQKLGVVTHAAGHGARAGRAFERAAALATGAPRIRLLRHSAQSLLSSGRPKEGDRVLDEVFAAVGSRRPKSTANVLAALVLERWRLRGGGLKWTKKPLTERQRLRLEALDVAASTLVQRDPMASWLYAQVQLRLALKGDDERLLLRAVSHELVLASTEPHSTKWIDGLVELGRKVSETVDDAAAVAWFEHALGMRAFLAGDWSVASKKLAHAEEMLRTRCRAVHWELRQARHRYVAAIQIEGDMAAPEEHIRCWLEDAERRDDTESIVGHLFGLGYCHLSNDTPEKIWPLTDRVRKLVHRYHEASLEVNWLEALAHCYEGATEEQLRTSLSRVRTVHKTMQGRVVLYRVWSRGYEARLLGALGRVTRGSTQKRVLKDMRRTQKALRAERWRYAHNITRSLEASLAFFEGDRQKAATLLSSVAEAHLRQGARLFAGVYYHASAQVCGNQKELEHATKLLQGMHVKNVERMARAHLPAFYRLD